MLAVVGDEPERLLRASLVKLRVGVVLVVRQEPALRYAWKAQTISEFDIA